MSTVQHTSTYLASLPLGAGSHPECLVKGWLVNAVLRGDLLQQDLLPPVILKHLQPAPLASAWVNQVAFHAGWQALLQRFAEQAAAARWWSIAAQRIVAAPFARPLLHYERPDRFLARLPANWELMYKGSAISVDQMSPTRAHLKLTYPKGLFSRSIAALLPSLFLGGLTSSAAHEPTVRFAAWTPEQSEYVAAWSKPQLPSWPKS